MSDETPQDVLREIAPADDPLKGALVYNAGKAREEARYNVAQYVMRVYTAVVSAVAVYLGIRGIWWGDNVGSDFLELLKIGVVPIVTLVIGFYFGSEIKAS